MWVWVWPGSAGMTPTLRSGLRQGGSSPGSTCSITFHSTSLSLPPPSRLATPTCHTPTPTLAPFLKAGSPNSTTSVSHHIPSHPQAHLGLTPSPSLTRPDGLLLLPRWPADNAWFYVDTHANPPQSIWVHPAESQPKQSSYQPPAGPPPSHGNGSYNSQPPPQQDSAKRGLFGFGKSSSSNQQQQQQPQQYQQQQYQQQPQYQQGYQQGPPQGYGGYQQGPPQGYYQQQPQYMQQQQRRQGGGMGGMGTGLMAGGAGLLGGAMLMNAFDVSSWPGSSMQARATALTQWRVEVCRTTSSTRTRSLTRTVTRMVSCNCEAVNPLVRWRS